MTFYVFSENEDFTLDGCFWLSGIRLQSSRSLSNPIRGSVLFFGGWGGAPCSDLVAQSALWHRFGLPIAPVVGFPLPLLLRPGVSWPVRRSGIATECETYARAEAFLSVLRNGLWVFSWVG